MIRQAAPALTAFLDKPVEGAAKLHQARALILEHVPDRAVLELGRPVRLGVGAAWALSHAFRSARLFTRGLGRNIWSRRLPTWFSTCPFSQPDAGVHATGSTR